MSQFWQLFTLALSSLANNYRHLHDFSIIMERDRGGLAALILLFSIVFIDSAAQSVGNYSVTRNTGISYNSIISTGSSFSGWRYSGAFSEDDNRSVATDIGFDFWYNGARYTQFSVSTNGFLDFSSSTDDGGPICDAYGYCNDFFTDRNAGTWLALAPFYDDMTTGGGTDPLGTSIKYLVSGTAPNRVLTVEWDGMAVYLNTTPDVNFQVKLYETTGVIEYIYGTMDDGTNPFTYTIGINAASVSNRPRTTELLTQQTANTANFTNSVQNNLSTMPEANSKLTFTPPTPSNPPGSLSITGVTSTGMTLNWANWAGNEVGYVLYYSTDNVNYFFQTQTAANATSEVIAGLSPNTLYYWKVYAVTEGTLSQPLSANATTAAAGTITSIASGRWNNRSTWDCDCVPTIGDNVIIAETHTVRIRNGNASCNDLVIGAGTSGSLRFIQNNARILNVNGNLVINTGASLDVRPDSETTHTFNIKGDITNNGSIQLAPDANSLCITNFIKVDGNQLVSGSGGTTQFYTININKNLKSNVLEVTSTNFSCDPDALNFISGGTFKFSSGGSNSFSLFNTARTIPANGSIWMNSALGFMNFPTSVTVQGDLRIDQGVINIGDAVNENLISNGGWVTLNGGTINIAGQLTRSTTESTTSFNQTNGVINISTIGSTSTVEAPFSIDVIGSEMNVSGGTIVLLREGGNGANDLGINTSGVTNFNISGGTLQIGGAASPVAQNIGVELGTPIGNLLINSDNVTATLIGNDITVLKDVTLSSGTLNDNGLDIDLSGDWLVTSGLFQTSVTGSVNFVGSGQSITSAGTSFSNLNMLGSGIKSVVDNLSVTGDLTIASELGLASPGLQISIGGNWINNGIFTRNSETILFNGVTDQSLGGTTLNSINNINVNKAGGALNVNSNVDFYGTMEIQSATTVDLDGAGAGVFRLISSETDDARIGQLASGAALAGDMIFEKYFAGQGIKYWRHIGTAVLDATIADMQNEIPISGTFTGNQNGTGVIPSFAAPSLYKYDPTSGLPSGTLDDRWVVYPTSANTETFTSPTNPAQGYAIWVRDTGPTTFDLTGPTNYGDIDFNLSGANEGWNLIANPYPSDIDWDAATGWTKTDIQGNAIHVWDGTQYLVWNGSIGSLGNGRIAKGQGFWVQAATTGAALLASESVKTGTEATTYRLSGDEMAAMPVIELSLLSNGNVDKSYIQFNRSASENLDRYDVAKLTNAIFNFSTLSHDSVNLSINSYQTSSCSFEIPLVIQNAGNGDYRLSWNIDNAIFSSYEVRLFDKISGEGQDISSTTNGLDFSVDQSTGTELENRFYLEFIGLEPNENLAIQTTQECASDGLTYISLGNTQFNYNYDLSFNDSTMVTIAGTGYEEILDITNYLRLGHNSINISAYNKSCSASRFSSVYEVNKVSQPTILYNDDLNILYEQDSLAGVWYLDNQLISGEEVPFIKPDSKVGGVYTLLVSNDNCEFVSNEYLVTATHADLEVKDVILSPNPTAHSITINYLGYSSDSFSEIIIHDFSGRIMHSSVDGKQTIDVSGYPKGVYILSLRGPLQTITKRFIKQ